MCVKAHIIETASANKEKKQKKLSMEYLTAVSPGLRQQRSANLWLDRMLVHHASLLVQ